MESKPWQEVRQRHQRVKAAPWQQSYEDDYCDADHQPWPCDAVQLLDVADKAVHFTATWEQAVRRPRSDPDALPMSCEQAQDAALLWAITGDPVTALVVVDNHVQGAPAGDPHHQQGDK